MVDNLTETRYVTVARAAVNPSMQHVENQFNSYGRACNVVLKRYGSWKSVRSPAFLS